MLTDANGDLIPQLFDPSSDSFVPWQTDTAFPLTTKGMTEFATGTRVVSSTASEIYAGTAPLTGRRTLMIRNEDSDISIRIGDSNVTLNNGFSIAPQSVMVFDLEPSNPVSIYAVSEKEVMISVLEAK
jgi:hypothetical protein